MMKKAWLLYFSFLIVISVHAQVPTVENVKETSADQSRDLSFPESRIVINPFDFNKPGEITQSEYSNAPDLPLNTGYLSTEKVPYRVVRNILNLYRYDTGSSGGESQFLWKADLSNTDAWEIQSQAYLEVTEKGLRFTLDANPDPLWKCMNNSVPVVVDFDKNPVVIISIPEFEGDNWSLKMKDERGTEKVLRNDAPGTGIFEYPMEEISGWTGQKEITFTLFCIGRNSTITIDDWGIIELGTELAVKEASEYSTVWMPNELPFEAKYEDGSSLEGTDFFYDINTIVRKVNLNNIDNGNKFLLSGAYSGQEITFENNILIQNKGIYSIAISVNAWDKFPVKFYGSATEMKMQINGKDAPRENGYWAVQIDASQLSDITAVVSYSYLNDSESAEALLNRVKEPLKDNNAEKGYEATKKYWNNYLAKIPHPSVFEIETTENKDVSGDDIRLAYYKAWTFVASNLLQGDPVKFPYPQVVTGKASMWDEGHELAPYSATWENFFGIQFLAFTDPENAWESFEGIMSLTDEDGVIGGESLPSRKAQTAWLLYQITGDKERLLEVYAPLERYLNWRMKYPHWIFYSEPDERLKDAEFVFSAIVDMHFMSLISKEVKDENIAASWEKKRQDFYTESLPWFWKTPKVNPVQYYNTETQDRNSGNRYWVTTGLFMDMLEGEYLQSMMTLFSMGFNAKNNFGGSPMGIPKYPDISYTIYGLIEKGYTGKAENVIDACMRDIVRSGNWFAEHYSNTGEPYPLGVRPSLFGASIMIDFVMMKNGFRYDSGTPMALNAFEGPRSIKNINYNDEIINISRNNSGEFYIDGSYVGEGYSKPSENGDYFVINKKGGGSSIDNPEKNKPYTIFNESGKVFIRLNISNAEKVSLQVFGLDGKVIQQLIPAKNLDLLTLQNLQKGIYILKIQIGDKKYNEKIVVL